VGGIHLLHLLAVHLPSGHDGTTEHLPSLWCPVEFVPMIDILYVSYNRLAFTIESFTALMENTEQKTTAIPNFPETEVATVYVLDDASDDGSAQWLTDAIRNYSSKFDFCFYGNRFGGPVAAMNWYLEKSDSAIETFCKIDNDFIVPPGWFRDMGRVHYLQPEQSIIGFEPMQGDVTPCPHERTIEPARWIGGKGFLRKRAFSYCQPSPGGHNGYGGFTEWQSKHEFVTKCWVTPDLPAFGIDQLPHEHWQNLTEEYTAKGYSRRWPCYTEDMYAYWDWWTPVGGEA
jgi:glycosyltransferase involved in cell wall biosynthesis